MTAADKIHALADTGTPGPYWVADGSQWEVPVRAKDPSGKNGVRRIGQFPLRENAVKYVVLVNAGHELADLIAAIDAQENPGDLSDIQAWEAGVLAARDALVQALGVTA